MQLIFLHAFPVDERAWEHQREVFAIRTIAPNLYCSGDSIREWATAVLESTSGDDLVVVGASMGASCALEMARQAGDRIRALVLAGAKAGHRPQPELRDRYIAQLLEDGIAGVWTDIVAQGFGSQADPKIVAKVRRMAEDQSAEDLVRAVRAFHTRPDLTDVVRCWTKPLVAISGDQGRLESAEKAVALAALAPNGRAYVLRGCGHHLNLERPVEFNAIISNVLAEID